MDKQEILDAIRILESNHENLRKLLRYRKPEEVGQRELKGNIFNSQNNFSYVFRFERTVDNQTIKELNHWGHYLNQNVIIRLFAILQEFDVLKYGKEVDKTIAGGQEMVLLKKLRHVLAHESGQYFPKKNNHRKTAELMIELLGINFDLDNSTEFDLSISTVIRPLFNGARQYLSQL